MVRFKKLSISKRIVAISLSILMAMMSIPVGTMLNANAAANVVIDGIELKITDFDPLNAGNQIYTLEERDSLNVSEINQKVRDWLTAECADISTEDDILNVEKITIQGALDKRAYDIIGTVIAYQSDSGGAINVTDIVISTSGELDGAFIESFAFLGDVSGMNLDVTLENGATTSDLGLLDSLSVESITVESGATLSLEDDGPEIIKLILDGGILDLNDITDINAMGVRNIVSNSSLSKVIFSNGSDETDVEDFFNLYDELEGNVIITDGTSTLAKATITADVSISGWTFRETTSTPSLINLDPDVLLDLSDITYYYSADSGGFTDSDTPAFNAAGGYSVYAVIDTDDYEGITASTNFTIDKATPTISLSATPTTPPSQVRPGTVKLTADGLPTDATGTLTFKEGTNTIGTVTLPTLILNFTPTTDQDSYSFTVEYSGDNNYSPSTSAALDHDFEKTTFDEGAFTVDITGWTYGSSANSPIIKESVPSTYTGTIAYQYSDAEAGEYSDTVPTNAGNYWAKAYFSATADYNEYTSPATSFTIDAKDINITGVTTTDRQYNGSDVVALTAGSLVGLVSGDESKVGIIHGDGIMADANVGIDKPVTTNITLSGDAKDNYNLIQPANETPVSNDILVTITPKQITLDITIDNKYYDATNEAFISNIKFTDNAIESNDVGNIDFRYKDSSDAKTNAAFNSIYPSASAIGVTFVGFELYSDDATTLNNYSLYESTNGSPIGKTAVITQWNPTITDGTHYTVSTANGGTKSGGVDYGWYKQGENFIINAANGYQLSLVNDGTDWQTGSLPTYSSDSSITGSDAEFYVLDNVNTNADLGTKAISAIKTVKYQLDHTAPTNLKVEYATENLKNKWLNNFINIITFGFFGKNTSGGSDNVTVTLSADDETSGIEYFDIYWQNEIGSGNFDTPTIYEAKVINDSENNSFICSFELTSQMRGKISFKAYDVAGNAADSNDNATNPVHNNNVVVIDTISPTATITYDQENLKSVVKWEDGNRQDVPDETEGLDTRYIYDDSFTATVRITDANYDLWDADPECKPTITVFDYKANKPCTDFTESNWKFDSETDDTYYNELTFKEKGDYEITITYKDRSDNTFEPDEDASEYRDFNWEKDGDDEYTYTSNVHAIDLTAPEISHDYNPDDAKTKGYKYSGVFGEPVTVEFTVTDHNFRPFEIGKNTCTFTAFGVDNSTVAEAWDAEKNTNYDDFLNALSSWEGGSKLGVYEISGWEETFDGSDVWKCTVTFIADANYEFSFEYDDLAGRKSPFGSAIEFTVDQTSPKDLTIEYSGATLLDSLLEAITFGFYQAPVKVTLTATDVTSAIDYFAVNSTPNGSSGATDADITSVTDDLVEDWIAASSTDATKVCEFTIPAQYRGTISFTAVDRAKKETDSSNLDDQDVYTSVDKDGNKIKTVVVDTISPTATITYDTKNLKSAVKWEDGNRQDVPEDEEERLYTRYIYDGSFTATVRITDANYDLWNADPTLEPDIKIEKLSADGSSKTELALGMGYTATTGWTPETDDVYKKVLTFTEEGDYVITIEYKDCSGNPLVQGGTEKNHNWEDPNVYTSNVHSIDLTAPIVEIRQWDPATASPNAENYKVERKTTIRVTEHNFRSNEFNVSEKEAYFKTLDIIGNTVEDWADVKANFYAALQNWNGGFVQDVFTVGAWRKVSTDVWEVDVTFKADARYDFAFNYTDLADRLSNTMTATPFVVDKTASDKNITITYETPFIDKIIETVTFGFYNPTVEVTLTADDPISGIDYFDWTYTQEDGTSDINKPHKKGRITHNPTASANETKVSNGGSLPDDANNTLLKNIVYTNGNKTATGKFTLTADELNQYRGSIIFTATDRAGNTSAVHNGNGTYTDGDGKTQATTPDHVVVVDSISPEIKIQYEMAGADELYFVDSASDDNFMKDAADQTKFTDENTLAYYNGSVSATVTINEANFFDGIIDEKTGNVIHNIIMVLEKTDINGKKTYIEYKPADSTNRGTDIDGVPQIDETVDNTWKQTAGTDEWKYTLPTYSDDADYVLRIDYQDLSTNKIDVTTDYGTTNIASGAYVSNTVTVDTTPPEIHVSYNPATTTSKYPHAGIFGEKRVATVTITERNFRPDDVIVEITAKNYIKQNITAFTYTGNFVNEYAAQAKDRTEWTDYTANWHRNDNTYELTIEYEADAVYTFDIGYKDLARNSNNDETYSPNDDYRQAFTVDKSNPDNLKIEYKNPTFISNLLQVLTFGFYKPNVTVVISADDETSGIDYFTVNSTPNGSSGATNIDFSANMKIGAETASTNGPITNMTFTKANANAGSKTTTASFRIPNEYRGFITFTATDMAGKEESHDSKEAGDTADHVLVVDTIKPNIDGEGLTGDVSYTPTAIKRKSDLSDLSELVKGDSILYYDNTAVATVEIEEVNFDLKGKDDVVVTVTKNGESFPVETANYDKENWKLHATKQDVWVNTITLHADANGHTLDGDYIITINYTDRTNNVMTTYVSERITIDTIAPVIGISYNNNSAKNDKYFNNDRTATITVTERNFRADDIKVTVTATDILGTPVAIPDYDAYLKNRLSWWPNYDVNWHTEGETHVATITYSADANYTFAIEYADLAKRSNAGINYGDSAVPEEFTVDHYAPTDLAITYDRNPIVEFLNVITFNFFKPTVVVTVTIEEATAGIDMINYWYGLDDGVSAINKGGEGVLYTGADSARYSITNKASTKEYKISFTVEPQFRGKVRAAATDQSGNATNEDRKDTLVVDNVAPVITVTYQNENALNITNDGRYYKEDQTAKIEIDEANFYEEDVYITVGKRLNNEMTYTETRVQPAFMKNGDVYTAYVDFKEDADYTFAIEYTDKSDNTAIAFAKDSFTIDKIEPVIKVAYDNTGSENTNYYKAERTATITIEEHNFNAADAAITVVATDDGATIAAPKESAWSTNGDVHTATIRYTVDALYHFSIAYTDLAGNDAAVFTPDEFYVDKTAPEITIENVSDRTAYADVIQPAIRLFDINYGGDYTVTLRRTDIKAGNEDVYAKLDKVVTNSADGHGITISFANIPTEVENDGIYDLSITHIDKAGNETVKTITFSVNRFGSTYYFADKATKDLVDKTDGKNYINKEINIKIGEINVDPLMGSIVTVSRNNDVVNELKDGDDYDVLDAGEAGGWYACVYDIKAANFSSEGFYTVIVASTDTAEHTSKNTVPVAKGNELPVEFTVDKTVPELTIKNIESRRAYSDAERKVTIESTDINLDYETLMIILDDKEVTIDKAKLVPDQFGKLSVEITVKANNGRAQTLEAKIYDLADNEQTETVTRFTLSANIFQLWYQNKLLFVLSMVGIVILSGGISLLLWKRRIKVNPN